MELTTDADAVSAVQLVARRPNGGSDPSVWALRPFDPFDATCANDAGVCVLQDAPDPAVSLAPLAPPPPLHKGLRTPSFAATLVQLKDFQNATETLYLLPDAGVFRPAPPGAMFSNGSVLCSSYVDSTGLRVVQLDPLTNTWSLNDELVSGDTAAFSSDALSFPISQGFFDNDTPTARRVVLARTSKTNAAVMFARTAAGAWGSVSVAGASPTNVISIRAVRPDPTAGAFGEVYAVGRSSVPALVTRSEHAGYSGPIPESGWSIYPSASSFDVAHLNAVIYAAFISNDDLNVAWCAYNGSSCPITFLQAPGGGTALDANPVCSPNHPELTMVRNGLVLTWQERCGSGPWRVHARGIR